MRTARWLCALIAALLSRPVFAYPGPLPGTENIPKLMEESALVCKGEVIDAPGVIVSSDPRPPHNTATALLHLDRCFKGALPSGGLAQVLFDNVLPNGGGPYVVVRKNDYRLFFLNSDGNKYVLADRWFGQLTISRELDDTLITDTDPMHRLEADLKAGLNDSDRDRVLDSIRMLGNMRRLQSKAELISLLDSHDELVRTYVLEAMLRLHDYSVLPLVEDWIKVRPNPPTSLILPRDSLFDMQFRLALQLSTVRDPAALPVLLRLLESPRSFVRQDVLQAVRAIKSPQSASALLAMLDDPYPDNAFSAMQGLLELPGGGPIAWVPTLLDFRENPKYYAAECREWWQTERQSGRN